MLSFILKIFVIWRIFLFVAAWIGGYFLSFNPSFPYSDVFLIPSGLPQWIWSFANFDGVHYLTIAQKGYSAQFTQVFFPLYPYLITIINSLLPFINSLIIGLFISNITFLFSLVIFYKLLRLDYHENLSKWMIFFLLFFPTSFFFGSLYTESLFIFLVFSSFYVARKKRWWLAGILGAFASATRPIGIFLLPALLWEWQNEKFKVQSSKFKVKERILHITYYILHSPVLYLVPLGLLFYMLYLQIKFGDFLYFWHAQPVFGAQRSGGNIILLPQVFWRYFKIFLSVSFGSESFWIPVLEFLSTVGAIVLLLIAQVKRVRQSYLIFSYLIVLVPTLTGTLSSMPRYILPAFPIFIVLGLIKNTRFKIFILFLSFLLLSVLTVIFTRGHWVS